MAKKDFNSTEDIDRGGKKESDSKNLQEQIPVPKTEVKNANASGQGSMGRNDEAEEHEQSPANS